MYWHQSWKGEKAIKLYNKLQNTVAPPDGFFQGTVSYDGRKSSRGLIDHADVSLSNR